jgi:hypothetical protein
MVSTCVPRAFSRLPLSFSIMDRALAKLNAAFDSVLPLVHVFSVPYFLPSSHSLFPAHHKARHIPSCKLQIPGSPKGWWENSAQLPTYLDLLRPGDDVALDAPNYIPLEVLGGNENATHYVGRA